MKIRNRHGHFDLIAPIYDRFFGGVSLDQLFQHLDVRPGDLVLDIGGGTGRVARHVVERGGQVIVVDPSPRMLQSAREKNLVGVRALAEQLPFPADSIDRILIVDAFHHFAQQELAARDLMRVLKPGGKLVIEEPDLNRTATKFIAWAEKLALMQTRFLSPEAMIELFREHGAHFLTMTHENISAQMVFTK
jgi:demethylmenaquinone methyltransferase/2-methoxy-6-polyprenyl-1,4-benzoquinol methylase